MFTRRRMLAVSFLSGIFGFTKPLAKADTVPTEYDSVGRCVAQAYRVDENGQCNLVKRSDLKPGDTFIMIGVENNRLWRVVKYKVSEDGYFTRMRGKGMTESVGVESEGEAVLITDNSLIN